jgi:hypothetical protein
MPRSAGIRSTALVEVFATKAPKIDGIVPAAAWIDVAPVV